MPYFLNQLRSPSGRIADVQKCMRAGGKHNDLGDVGYDTYHHTFFEMLGNWSFGDYFKEEAICWAWELLVERWGFPKERLFATVYRPLPGEPASYDDEAYAAWANVFCRAGLDPEEHITCGGARENFWMMGETGPCGPCTEIHMDLTPAGNGGLSLVNGGNPRCMELWNLVFIQYNALENGKFEKLSMHYVDTGMGLERVAGILATTDGFRDFSRTPSNYGSGLFRPIFEKICELGDGKVRYGNTVPANRHALTQQESVDCAFRVLADHARALTMAIGDGIFPGNEGRGYVLRRILRRAVLFGRRLGLRGHFMAELAKTCATVLRPLPNHGPFPLSFASPEDFLPRTLDAEQDAFGQTMDRGLRLLGEAADRHGGKLPGDALFELHDTYGFPLDLSQLIAAERGISVDLEGFERAMERQKNLARMAKKVQKIAVEGGGEGVTEFVGYGVNHLEGHRTKLLQSLPRKENGQFLVFASSPFYGERGGQVGDRGTVRIGENTFEILDTQHGADGLLLHAILSTISHECMGEMALLSVDIPRRRRIAAHHTATHLIQAALRQVIGEHVTQAGSSVTDRQLRFDFSHFRALEEEQLRRIETLANGVVRANIPLRIFETDFHGKPAHCLAHFGERYGSRVRVVEIGDTAELCGGTHVAATGEIGTIKILSEGAIAAGVRRLVAVAGEPAQELFGEIFRRQRDLATELHCETDGLQGAVAALRERTKILEKQMKQVEQGEIQRQLEELTSRALTLEAPRRFGGRVQVGDAVALRTLVLRLAEQFSDGVFFLVSRTENRWIFAIGCGKEALGRGNSAKNLATIFAEKSGGRGGGKDDFASGTAPGGVVAEEIVALLLRS